MNTDHDQQQRIVFRDFQPTKLKNLISPHTQSLSLSPKPWTQVEYLERYLETLGCQTIVLETHYIDRDYIEDFGAFYSRNLLGYPNWCRRYHFFRGSRSAVRRWLQRVIEAGRKAGEESYKAACAELSDRAYLGFSVIKPLSGCPVGRTVLRAFDPPVSESSVCRFDCTLPYRAHLLGVELTVLGLAFQQQDAGVSACATTALWSALQKTRDFEAVSRATPAQITLLASRWNLPFGRAMPSEGLSIDQMCMAVQALGLAPSLVRAEEYEQAQQCVYASTASGFPSILVLQDPSGNHAHAVTVTGMKLREDWGESLGRSQKWRFANRAEALKALFVHDDRHGPYLTAEVKRNGSDFRLRLKTGRDGTGVEEWVLSHILIPMHGKIRLSFGDLGQIALGVVGEVHPKRLGFGHEVDEKWLSFETFVVRSPHYVQRLVFDVQPMPQRTLQRIFKLKLSRYIGVIRFESSHLGEFDVLVDSTSTSSNLRFLAIIRRGSPISGVEPPLLELARKRLCPLIF